MKEYIKQCIIFSLLAFISIMFIDKPLCLWIHYTHLDELLFLRYITEGLPKFLPLLGILVIIFAKPQVNIGNKWLYIIYLACWTQITSLTKTGIKGIFARHWTKTWINNNPSLIRDHVYGFNWFRGFDYNGGAFPSGHVTFIAIICLSLAITYPQFRKLWYFLIGLIICTLVILDFHFLGDCFAALALASLFAGIGFQLYSYCLDKWAYRNRKTKG